MRLQLAIAASLLVSALAQSDSIADIVVANQGTFGYLLAAVQAAGLVDTLAGPGTFTVFAPDDAAFGAVPAGPVKDIVSKVAGGMMLSAAEKEALTSVLLYHVLPNEVVASDIINAGSPINAKTVQGEEVTAQVRGGNVFINNAQVTQPDLFASNGVIHKINGVLLPPSLGGGGAPSGGGSSGGGAMGSGTIVDVVVANQDTFSTLLAAVQAAGLASVFSAPGRRTVFAPTNAAFAALPRGSAEAGIVGKVAGGQQLADAEVEALKTILFNHVVDQQIMSRDIPTNRVTPLRSVTFGELRVDPLRGGIFVNDAQVINPDIMASNGVIHAIDSVLGPQAGARAPMPCRDLYATCSSYWATFRAGQSDPRAPGLNIPLRQNYCDANAAVMYALCAQSCGQCGRPFLW